MLGGFNDGWFKYFTGGFGLDFDYQSAATEPGAALATVRWQTGQTRLRLEAAADVLRVDVFDVGEAHLGVTGGLGATMGLHWISVGSRAQPELVLGPTVRLGVTAGFQIGPGAITATVPVDWSVDVIGPVRNFAPLAATVYLGYRLEL